MICEIMSLKIFLISISILPWFSAANESNLLNHNDELYSRDFYSVPTTVKTFENDTVLLPCGYKLSFSSVRWLRDEDLLMEAPFSEQVYLDRYHLLANGSLVVTDVQPEDTGRYYCEIMASSGKSVQAHAIEVQYAPRVFATPSGFIEMPIGADFEIICETEGVPQPAVTWTHNNNTIIEYGVGNRQTYIVNVRGRNMSGNIDCSARNGVGQAVSDGVELLVLFSPEIRAPQKIYYSKIGGRLQLECFVESAPLAKVRWFHAGKPISLGVYYNRQDTEELPKNATTSQHYYSDMKHALIIKNAHESDMGMYECRAENSIGIQSAYMEVTFRPMPCSFKISPDMQSPTSHVLVWQTESNSAVVEFKLKFRQVPSESVLSFTTMTNRPEWNELTIPSDISIGPIYTTTYTLYGLHPASIYQVVVLARNHFGWSDSSKILRFATGGEVEFPNYSTEADKYGIVVNDNDNNNNGATNDNDDVEDDDDDDDVNKVINSNDITENSIVAEKKDKTLLSSMYVSSTGCRSSQKLIFKWWIIISAFVIVIEYKLY